MTYGFEPGIGNKYRYIRDRTYHRGAVHGVRSRLSVGPKREKEDADSSGDRRWLVGREGDKTQGHLDWRKFGNVGPGPGV